MTIRGEVVRVLFSNESNGYTVAHLRPTTQKEPVVITGTLPQLRAGEALVCEGEWIEHKKFGTQFEVASFQVLLPLSREGIAKYLSSGFIRGVGAKTAKMIVDAFGERTFEIIENEPHRLEEIKYLKNKKPLIEQIVAGWKEQTEGRDIMMFLQQYEISPNFAQRIYKEYGQQSVSSLRQNPYNLARDVIGISFMKADEIAQQMGMGKDSSQRIESGMVFMLQELAAQQGHTCVPLADWQQRACTFLKIEAEQAEKATQSLLRRRQIAIDYLRTDQDTQPFVWLQRYYAYEQSAVDEIVRLQSAPPLAFARWREALDNSHKALKIDLAPQQQEALEGALQHKIHIITGGAGTGKSTIVKVLLQTWLQRTELVQLAAPTGRAAKRLHEVTGQEASTIHSLLGGSAFDLTRENIRITPLAVDVLIVDEASMLESAIFSLLLRSLPTTAHLVLVGDVDQLPSVGAGNVLKDLIDSQLIPMTRLTEIFRQSHQSDIIRYAHDIKTGTVPHIVNRRDGDCFLIPSEIDDESLPQLIQVVSQRLPNAYGLHQLRDIQVLTPMNKGKLGTRNLNNALQQALNPNAQSSSLSFEFGSLRFAVGDKVIQTKNNYEKNVFNGDIGYITRIDLADALHWVDFDGREVEFKRGDCMDMDLAYAITVHKYQGSESPAVVLTLSTSHSAMLYRNLLYTAVTRARKLLIIIGSMRAIDEATHNISTQRRYTGLQQMLRYALLGEENSNDSSSTQKFPPIRIMPMLGSEEYEAFLEREELW